MVKSVNIKRSTLANLRIDRGLHDVGLVIVCGWLSFAGSVRVLMI